MAKSIGTLKAMLVLDSKGFLGGFTKASQATASGMRAMARESAAGAAWLRWSVALRAARTALRSLASDIMKFRETSPIVNAAVESFFALGRSIRDNFLHPMMEAMAPAFTFVFESALEAINSVGQALGSMGIGFGHVATVATMVGGVVGNVFKLVGAGVESTLALMEESLTAFSNMAIDVAGQVANAFTALLLGIQGSMLGIHKILGDFGQVATKFGGMAGMLGLGISAKAQDALAGFQKSISELTSGVVEFKRIGLKDLKSPDNIEARQRGIDAQGRWQDAIAAIGKIMSGDISGVKPQLGSKAFVPKTKQDIDMPALEQGTNKAFEMLMKIQRPDQKDHQKKVEHHLAAIDKNTQPQKGGDALRVAKLGGR